MRTKRKIHYLFFTIIFLLVIAAAYFQFAPYSLELSHSEEELTLEYGQAATLSNLTACYRVFPFREGGIELPVTPTQVSDLSNVGPNKISYSAKFLWKTLLPAAVRSTLKKRFYNKCWGQAVSLTPKL